MDRHLIYPPGWNNRKRKRPEEETDEEAAARLTGVVTVPGTTVVLNTPDTIQAWIAERKKRYPFQKRVEEKEQALKDAIDRGQILPPDKKRRPPRDHNTRGRGGLGRGRGRGGRPPSHRGRLVAVPGREQQSECATRKPGGTPEGRNVLHTVDTETDGISAKIFHDIQTSSGSESGSDLDPAKDAVSSRPPPGYVGEDDEEQSMDMVAAEHVTNDSTGKGGENGEAPSLETSGRPLLPPPRRKAPQPKRQPRAPFNDRPSLLRNLLLSDIRTTVSNLSQAIRFLVANDFLENVELKPGDAANPMIRVLETRPADNGGVDDDPSGQQ
ncbi:hypothetical protein FRB99_000179 [Tulasnella sp. 403]|nr:hypothetical protein FRB99_000179 [Tulasnella sp. 403]